MGTVSTPQNNQRKTIKRKLDESILQKARAALGLPLGQEATTEDEQNDDQPSLKWRKPRHNTSEGQIYIKNKEKRKASLMEEQRVEISSRTLGKNDKRSKKKRKNKKRKTPQGDMTPATKNCEGEKKHNAEAIAYLQLWTSNRDYWKFEKRKQTWLLKHCLNSNLISDEQFKSLLNYIASVKGTARQATVNEMQKVVTNKGTISYESNPDTNVGSTVNSESETMYDRARQIIQMLVD